MDIRFEEHVVADLPRARGGRACAGRVAQPGRRGGPAPASVGRDEEEQLVDEIGLEERGGERRAALEQQRLDALGRRARAAPRRAGPCAARGRGRRAAARARRRAAAAGRAASRRRARRAAAGRRGPCPPRPRPRPTARAARARAAGSPRRSPSARPGTVTRAVERHRSLVDDERPPLRRPRCATPRSARAPRTSRRSSTSTPGRAQTLDPARRLRDSGRARRRRRARRPPARIALGARRRRPVVRARLERHVERRAARALAGGVERDDLGVPAARLGRRPRRRPRRRATTTAPTVGFGYARSARGARELERAREASRERLHEPPVRAAAGPRAPKIADRGDERGVAPASRSRAMFVRRRGRRRPGSRTRRRQRRRAAAATPVERLLAGTAGPSSPGWIDMQRTRSASPATAATCLGLGSPGLNATPTCSPCSRAARIVAATSSTASKWNVTLSPPAVRDRREVLRRVLDHQVHVDRAAASGG